MDRPKLHYLIKFSNDKSLYEQFGHLPVEELDSFTFESKYKYAGQAFKDIAYSDEPLKKKYNVWVMSHVFNKIDDIYLYKHYLNKIISTD